MKGPTPLMTSLARRVHRPCPGLVGILLCVGSSVALAHPDLTGVWELSSPMQAEVRTPDAKEPPLNATAQATYAARRALYRAGNRSFDPAANGCGDPGMPRIMMMPDRFEIVQDADRVVTLFARGDRFRVIELKRKLEPLDLAYFGTANGHWEGDELVVESSDFRENTSIDAAGLPHSDAMRLVERYRLAKAGRELSDRIEISDPKTYTRSWTVVVNYRRLPPDSALLPPDQEVNCGPPAPAPK